MNGLLFILKGPDYRLAACEAKASFGWRWWDLQVNSQREILFMQGRRKVQFDLALTHRILKVVATCPKENLRATLSSIDWNIKGTYKIRVTAQISLEDVMGAVRLNNKVDLEHPDNIIEIVLKDRAYIGLVQWECARMPGSAVHPASLPPRMARAMVNLSCARSIHDPFCGSGQTLIEAGLSGRKASGADIDARMVRLAGESCRQVGLHPDLRVADATEWLPRCQAIVTDLPYGKATKRVNIKPFTEAFLKRAATATSRIVMGVSTAIPIPSPWIVREHFALRVNKSLTRHIYILGKDS